MNHKYYMQRCLDLAKLGLSQAAPNPSVGAVLVHDNEIISEGFTAPYGGAHAEVNCIANVAKDQTHLISKSTLYVSLEPCSHFGKTPPCSQLIIESNITKVVIATLDPNPKVAGNGVRKLRAAGVNVLENILEKEALEVNKRFFTFHTKQRPYITLKWAQTPNGFFSPNNEEQFWITGKKTKSLVHKWRSEEMGILVGAKTITTDNPRLNVRLIDGKNPIRIVINTQENLASNLHIFQDGGASIIFSYEQKDSSGNVQYIKLDKNHTTLNQVLSRLYELEINSILVEGGAFTLKEFISNDLWDEARVLTGSKELEAGLPAPQINGALVEEFYIEQDKIQTIKNKA